MRAMRAWHDATARSITSGSRVHTWLSDLVARFGDERVADAIEDEAPRGAGKLLSRVADRLAREDARHRPGRAPVELGHDQLLAVARGEEPVPDGPVAWDWRGLSAEEEAEVLEWWSHRHDRAEQLALGEGAGR